MTTTDTNPQPGSTLSAVFETVMERKQTMPEQSYVATLLRAGTDTILCKLAEESGEVVKAAREEDKEGQVKELCDLFFHAMVLMADKDISLAELEAELGRRHGVSGLDEKASRNPGEKAG